MRIKVECASITEFPCDLLVVNEFEGVKHPGGATGAVDKALNGLITDLTASEEIDGKLGKTTVIHTQDKIPAKRVLVVGLGKREDFDLEAVRKVSAAALKSAKGVKTKKVATIVHGAGIGGLPTKEASKALVEGGIIGDYKYEEFVTKKEEPEVKIEELIIVECEKEKIKDIEDGARLGEVIASAVNRVRDLVNGPSNKITPTFLAEYAKGIGIECEVLGLSDIKRIGMEAIASVAKGSKEEPKVVVLKWKGEEKKKETIGLIGKGITFDAGGISLKDPKKLAEMKMDMAGAAVVIEVMRVVSQLNFKKNVIAVIPLTENMPDGGALKPGDIISSLAKVSIEIVSTDAEGRMILADAITYAKGLGATALIDIATLTGGCTVALGDVASGIFGNDQKLIDKTIEIGKNAGEKLWQLPIYKEYKEYLKSEAADIKNCMEDSKASPSTGAIFLQKFVEDIPWIHMDIAGTAYLDREIGYLSKGATGAGLRTIVGILMD